VIRKGTVRLGEASRHLLYSKMVPVPVKDQKTVEAVSEAYLEKYRGSPYAKDMVRPEVLPTTLRLERR
jgi:hypothetical protein